MSVDFHEEANGKVLAITASGLLSKADYERFLPEVERLIRQHGKIRILFEMIDFHGWEAAALWADIKFDAHHFNHIERIAMIGNKTWEHGMALFCKPFTTAQVRYFDQTDSAAGRAWILE